MLAGILKGDCLIDLPLDTVPDLVPFLEEPLRRDASSLVR
jgi:hypothetical protein